MKAAIRKKIISQRNSLSVDFVNTCQDRVIEQLLLTEKLPLWESAFSLRTARFVMSYSDFKNEIKTEKLNHFCFTHDIKLCLPVTKKSPNPSFKNPMDAYIVTADSILHPDGFGVPIPNTALCEKADPVKLDIIFVPGVAFDPSGNRLGFGKGYYDTFLPQAPNALKVALAYEFQILDQLPAEPWDVKMDYIVTEKRIINCSTGSSTITGK